MKTRYPGHVKISQLGSMVTYLDRDEMFNLGKSIDNNLDGIMTTL
jgi:hypothetical protein